MSLEKAIFEVGAVYGDVDKIENLRKLVSVEKRPYNSKKAAAETKKQTAKKHLKPPQRKHRLREQQERTLKSNFTFNPCHN